MAAISYSRTWGGVAKGGDLVLYVDGSPVGKGRIDSTVPNIFSADETTDVGQDVATPVSDDYGPKDTPSPVASTGFSSTWTRPRTTI